MGAAAEETIGAARVQMRKFVYADESGNFDFSRNRGASRYFVLATIAVEEHLISTRLQELRRKLLWNGEQPSYRLDSIRQTQGPAGVEAESIGFLFLCLVQSFEICRTEGGRGLGPTNGDRRVNWN